MVIQQSAALLQLIAFINEIRNDSDLMNFIKVVKDVEEVQRGELVPALPMLQLLGQVLTPGNKAYHPAFPADCAKLDIEKLESVTRRAEALSTREAVMTNMHGALMVNPVALAMLAQEGISVLIKHHCEEYGDEPDTYIPSVYYVTKNFVL
ncbi:hypothetical protein WJ97_13840 [Burkholderia ubonensis]|uniref:hypothetical protein n=1 Tax=Burkholderia ubonensis TaxID=101571 RepID=UPI00075F134A|nr:hypothetical protein [Burkholderia ubonensis]KVP96902.1 hypothetical protein WJ97_13840 [Burkholderia ubonensis]